MTHGGLAQGHPPSPLQVLPLPQPSDSPPSLPPSQSRVIYLPDGDRRQWLELELLSEISWRLQSKQPELISKRSLQLLEPRF